jgi:pyruvate dehydrogenase E1 component
VLGTDGFGRSDTRENLRSFFEVDRYHITIAALKSLADLGQIKATICEVALAKYGIAADVTAPWLR